MVQYNLQYLRKKTFDRTKYFCSIDFCVDKELKIKHYPDAYVDPKHGIWDRDKTFCKSSFKHLCPEIEQIESGGFSFFNDNEIEIIAEEVLYIGMFSMPWGHFFTDNIKQLWPLFSSKLDGFNKTNIPLAFITEHEMLPENFYRILDLLGIDRKRLRMINKPTKFKAIYVPDQCFFYDEKYNYELRCTREYYDLIERIVTKVDAENRYDKIFFTTSSFHQRGGNYGVEEFDELFKQLGYAIISPEKLDFVDMVALLKGCKIFASTEGSAGHNSLFLNKGTQCVFLRRVNAVNVYQHIINYVRDLDVTIIDAHLSFLLYYKPIPWNGPFFLYCSRQLRKWSGVYRPFPLRKFVQYVWDYSLLWIKSKLRDRGLQR